jgi:hypothetical protein
LPSGITASQGLAVVPSANSRRCCTSDTVLTKPDFGSVAT